MDADLKAALHRFLDELKNDIWFFGGCGFFVGLFMVWQSRLKELGLAKDPKWASDLFSDFMSLNAFGLVFYGYLLLACLSTAFTDLGRPMPYLDRMVAHMEMRLAQVASSLVAFSIGLLALVALYSILNLDSGGARLVALASLFSVFIAGTFAIALAVGRRTEPFNRWWVALMSMLALAGALWWLLVQSK